MKPVDGLHQPKGAKSGGKDKGKGKGNDKGSEGGKAAVGKDGKGKVAKGDCRLCGQPGHWKNECWLNRSVNQVENQAPSTHAQAFPTHASVLQPTYTQLAAVQQQTALAAAPKGSVKRVFVLRDSPEVFNLDSDADSHVGSDTSGWDKHDP